VGVEIAEGLRLLEAARDPGNERAGRGGRAALDELLRALEAADEAGRLERLMAPSTLALMRAAAPRADLSRYPRELALEVDRARAAFSAWYELFPRSMSDDETRHGTFDDVIAKLPYVRHLGFDVLYFP